MRDSGLYNMYFRDTVNAWKLSSPYASDKARCKLKYISFLNVKYTSKVICLLETAFVLPSAGEDITLRGDKQLTECGC